MGALRSMVKKEFRQLRRDRALLRLIIVLPLVQLFVLAYAITFDLRGVRVSVLDEDRSPESRELADALLATDVFVPGPTPADAESLRRLLEQGETDLALHFPRGLALDMLEGRPGEVGILVDGSNSGQAGRAAGYARSALALRASRMQHRDGEAGGLHSVTRFLYNSELESRIYMVPGILVMLVTLIGAMVTGMAVVREKEIGTLEQVMVTPLGAGQFIAGKLIPYGMITLLDLALALAIALLWFHVPFRGSVPLMLCATLAYVTVTLGLGLLASVVSSTQQQAMFTVWFYLVFSILLSGFFFPVQNMPAWAQALTWLDPMRFYLSIVRGVLLKGADFVDLGRDMLVLAGMGALTLGTAVLSFRKTGS